MEIVEVKHEGKPGRSWRCRTCTEAAAGRLVFGPDGATEDAAEARDECLMG